MTLKSYLTLNYNCSDQKKKNVLDYRLAHPDPWNKVLPGRRLETIFLRLAWCWHFENNDNYIVLVFWYRHGIWNVNIGEKIFLICGSYKRNINFKVYLVRKDVKRQKSFSMAGTSVICFSRNFAAFKIDAELGFGLF